jgi:hypothetical protein
MPDNNTRKRSARTDTDISYKGKSVCWTLGSNTDPKLLEQLLKNIKLPSPNGSGMKSYGWLAKHAPKPNSPKSALHAALMGMYGRSGHLVRTLKGKRGYAVVREEKNPESGATLRHTTLFEATLKAADSLLPDWEEIEENALPDALRAKIQTEFIRQQSICPHHTLARSVVRIVDALHGVCLRPTGGFYWLPEGAIDPWNAVADAIEKSGSGNRIYGFRTAFDEEAASTVLDALTRTVSDEAKRMGNEIEDDDLDLGEKALTTKLQRAKTLRRRLTGYRKMLGTVSENAIKKMDDDLEDLEASIDLAMLNVLASNQ